MVDAKTAALAAKKYYEDLTDLKQYRLQLEEVEFHATKKIWSVTLGIYTPTDAFSLISQGLKEALSYKVFEIDGNTGEVKSMKIKVIDFNRLKE